MAQVRSGLLGERARASTYISRDSPCSNSESSFASWHIFLEAQGLRMLDGPCKPRPPPPPFPVQQHPGFLFALLALAAMILGMINGLKLQLKGPEFLLSKRQCSASAYDG